MEYNKSQSMCLCVNRKIVDSAERCEIGGFFCKVEEGLSRCFPHKMDEMCES